MGSQIEKEVYAHHHRQQLMQMAHDSRMLNRIQTSNSVKKSNYSTFVSNLVRRLVNRELTYQVESTSEPAGEKKLASS